MAFEDADRRRTMLLALATLVTLPALWFVSRSSADADTDGANTTSPVATAAPTEPVATFDTSPNRPPFEAPDEDPIFMDGPESELSPGVPEVAIPERPDIAPLQFDASYRSTVAGVRSCLVRDLPSGLSITVTNLDNGRAITCVTSVAPFGQVDDIVLHTDTFSRLADLTESPIPVEVAQ